MSRRFRLRCAATAVRDTDGDYVPITVRVLSIGGAISREPWPLGPPTQRPDDLRSVRLDAGRLTSAALTATSFSTWAAKSAGVMGIGSKPSAASLSRKVGF